jgi:hypothetical protein
MPTISPVSVELEPSASQQFTQSGISSPVWTLDGDGSLNQSGFYLAPGSIGSANVRVHPSAWNSVNSAYWTKNADDSLTKNTDNFGGFAQATSVALLNNVGDFVEYISVGSYAYWIGLEDDSQTYRVVASSFAGGEIREYNGSFFNQGSIGGVITAGNVIKFEIIIGGYVQVKKNGTVVFTSTTTFLNKNLRFITDAGSPPIGTVFKLPKFSASNYAEAVATVLVTSPILLTKSGLELYCESNRLSLADNASVSSFTDLSGKGRNLTLSSNQPVYKAEDGRIEWNGSQSALKNTASFQLNCGFILAKYNGSTFADYKGLLSDCGNLGILVGNPNSNTLFNFGYNLYEFRTNDRIYPASAAPAPMNAFKLLFFKFWTPIQVSGIQIGDDRNFTGRKWNGSVKLIALYSRHFCEKDIRTMAKTIADAYTLTLADVFPYQADTASEFISSKKVLRSGNDEFGSVTRVKRGKKQKFKLNFTNRSQNELDSSDTYLDSHHPELPFVYRNYAVIPPRDTEVLTLSDEVSKSSNGVNLWNYSFEAREK